MEESHSNNDKDTCGPNGTGEPKSNSGECVDRGGRVGGTAQGLRDDLPDEYDESENVTSSDPEVGLVSWHQFLEVRKAKFRLQAYRQYLTTETTTGQKRKDALGLPVCSRDGVEE